MKRKIILTSVALVFSIIISTIIVNFRPIKTINGQYANVSTANLAKSGNNFQFISNKYRLDFVKGNNGYTVNFVNTKGEITFANNTPIKVRVQTTLNSSSESVYIAPYSTITQKNYGYMAVGRVETAKGSVFQFVDNYYLVNEQFAMDRTATVLHSVTGDYGFATECTFSSEQANISINNYDTFIPGQIILGESGTYSNDVWNKSSQTDHIWYKESALTLPMAMLRNKTTSDVFFMQRLHPNISSILGGGVNGLVNEKIKYGSLGYSYGSNYSNKASITFIYPAHEGEIYRYTSTSWASGVNYSYHPNYRGFTHSYTMLMCGDSVANSKTAIVNAYQKAFSLEDPITTHSSKINKVDINMVYKQNMDLFSAEYKEFGTGTIKSAGLPFAIDLADIHINEGYAFNSGFVGEQLPLAYQLYRYGIENNNSSIKQKGKTMLDFWSSSNIVTSTSLFPYRRWIATQNSVGGNPESLDDRYFLRDIVDAAEGMLDGYRFALQHGNDYSTWKNAALVTANILCSKANSDGSFYRCYNRDGTVYSGSYSLDWSKGQVTQASSKEITAAAVRYLYKCYELTGDTKYKDTANKAVNFIYNNYYTRGYFGGGTCDQLLGADREGSIYALYAFKSAYLITGESKFLEAAEYAAIQSIQYTYMHDYAVPNIGENNKQNDYNAFVNGGVLGFSQMTPGGVNADNFTAYTYYELFCLYVLTGKNFYLNQAIFHQKATKLSSNFDGRLSSYGYKAMCPEATDVSFFLIMVSDNFKTSTGTWLPWSGAANVEPIANMKWCFGNIDVCALQSTSISTLKSKLTSYGVGGKKV